MRCTLLHVAEDIAHLIEVWRRRIRITYPHVVGLFVGACQRLKVAWILRLLVLQLRVVARIEEDAIAPIVERLFPFRDMLHSALRHSVQQIGQLEPVGIQHGIVASVIVDELMLLQKVHVELLLALRHALLAFCKRKGTLERGEESLLVRLTANVVGACGSDCHVDSLLLLLRQLLVLMLLLLLLLRRLLLLLL